MTSSEVNKDSIHPVVLSGGSGTRLWPLSRAAFPKQLLPLAEPASLLQATLARTPAKSGFAAPLVVTGEDHRFLIADQLDAAGLSAAGVLLEPEGRNTAPAIALAAHVIARDNPDAVMLVMPSDHVISDTAAFHRAIASALPAARDHYLVTFGIRPDRAETGYGYIEIGDPLPGLAGVNSVTGFVEKPDATTAERFLAGGVHAWNGGIFMFTAKACLEALEALAPEVAEACRAAMADSEADGRFIRPSRSAFLKAPNISIDYAVMERAQRVAVVPVEMGWSDVGSWDALWAINHKDADGNACQGDIIAIDTHNCLFRIDNGPAIAAVGLKDTVVVSTRDAVLVIPRDRAQDVKHIVETLKASNSDRHQFHSLVHRPWGTYETTDRGDRFQTKRIVVKPGQKLSLQMHHHRSEHWIVVSGTARVIIGEEEQVLQENQSTYIPAGTVHRLENPGKIPLHLIEVQCGPYLGEDDIVRFEDTYGRVRKTDG